MKILISGFEPFGGDSTNPSEQLISELKHKDFSFELLGVVLPVSFEKSFAVLKEYIDQFQPDYVICTGLAKDRKGITVERIAVNIMNAPIPDNDGYKPKRENLVSDGCESLFSTLPVESILDCLKKAGIESSESHTAGTYVCNSLMYKVISYRKELGYKSGFVHLPPTPELVGGDNAMALDQISSGVVEILKVLEREA